MKKLKDKRKKVNQRRNIPYIENYNMRIWQYKLQVRLNTLDSQFSVVRNVSYVNRKT